MVLALGVHHVDAALEYKGGWVSARSHARSGDDAQAGVTERANGHILYAHSSDCALE